MKLLSTKSIYSRSLLLILMIIDIVGIVITYKLLEVFEVANFNHNIVFIGALFWIVINIIFGFYEIGLLIYYDKICYLTFYALFVYFSLIAFIYFIRFGELFMADLLPLLIVVLGFVMIILKAFFAFLIKLWRFYLAQHTSYIILGFNRKGFNINKQIESLGLSHKLVGFFDNTVIDRYVIGDLSMAKEFCKKHHVNYLYYALPYDLEMVQDFMNFADKNFIYFSFIHDTSVEEQSSNVTHPILSTALPFNNNK